MLPEENPELQQRTKQAALYFISNLKDPLSVNLGKLNLDTDNKALRKLLSESFEKLQLEIFIKLSCLENCQNGLDTISYLKTRADASLDFRPHGRQKAQHQQQYSKTIIHPVLFTELKRWRDDLADEMNIPKYRVLPQKSMLELMNKLPVTLEGLTRVKGIGKLKMKQFGLEIISIISTYCADHDIIPSQTEIAVAKRDKK